MVKAKANTTQRVPEAQQSHSATPARDAYYHAMLRRMLLRRTCRRQTAEAERKTKQQEVANTCYVHVQAVGEDTLTERRGNKRKFRFSGVILNLFFQKDQATISVCTRGITKKRTFCTCFGHGTYEKMSRRRHAADMARAPSKQLVSTLFMTQANFVQGRSLQQPGLAPSWWGTPPQAVSYH